MPSTRSTTGSPSLRSRAKLDSGEPMGNPHAGNVGVCPVPLAGGPIRRAPAGVSVLGVSLNERERVHPREQLVCTSSPGSEASIWRSGGGGEGVALIGIAVAGDQRQSLTAGIQAHPAEHTPDAVLGDPDPLKSRGKIS